MYDELTKVDIDKMKEEPTKPGQANYSISTLSTK